MSTPIFNGVHIFDEPIEAVVSHFRAGAGAGFSYVVTPNVDHFYRLDGQHNVEFNHAYRHADLAICDSRIVQKLSFFERTRIRNVVPGSDLTKHLLQATWLRERKVLIVGPTAEESERIAREFQLPDVVSYSPPMGFIRSESETSSCVDFIVATAADVVFIAVGSPQQEILASRVKAAWSSHKRCIGVCVGASFDFLSGKIERAPHILQVMHLEWLHRLLSEPRRLAGRYMRNLGWVIGYIGRHLSSAAKS